VCFVNKPSQRFLRNGAVSPRTALPCAVERFLSTAKALRLEFASILLARADEDGARFETAIDGTLRTYRDRRELAIEARALAEWALALFACEG